MGWTMIRSGVIGQGCPPPNGWARSRTIIAPIGGKPGRYFPVRSPMSGMPASTPPQSPRACLPVAFPYVLRSSGLSRVWCSAVGTTIGSTTLLVRGARWQAGHWQSARDQTTILSIDGKDEDQHTSHSTQKPVECMAWAIRNNSKLGDGVYEPFSGSGTTIIAAAIERCYAIELPPEYVDVAVLRWQAFTGNEATLQSSGSTYAAVTKTRTNDHNDKSSQETP